MVTATGGHFASTAAAARLRRTRRGRRRVQALSVHPPLPELVTQLNAFPPAVLAPYATTAALLATEQQAGRLRIRPALVALAAEGLPDPEIARIATRLREHRASVVLSLEGLEAEGQMRCAAAFLSALFDAPREHWYPALVVVDEAQLFAPTTGGEVAEEVRRASLSAMTNLMCRGRKRGLAGVIATQRLAKLAKNVAAEASNFLMGRTFLDIDMARAADLLGMERRQADGIRDLARGTFLALGPAVSRRPITVKIGAVATSARSGSPKLTPLPSAPVENLQELIFAPPPEEAPQLPMSFDPRPRRVPTDELLDTIERPAAPATLAPLPDKSDVEGEAIYAASKAAVVSLTQVMARELAESNITVNAVGPTPVKTDLIRSVPQEKMRALLARQAQSSQIGDGIIDEHRECAERPGGLDAADRGQGRDR